MPTFLARPQLYRILQRELPSDVYADGSPSAFFSTADMDSVAQVIADSYSNLHTIYLDEFPTTTEARISDWELKVLGAVGNALFDLDTRKANVLARLREQRGISVPIIESKLDPVFAIADIIDENATVVVPSWLLEVNGYLEVDDYIAFRDPPSSEGGLTYQLVEWCHSPGAWILDVSELEVSTYLSFKDPLYSTGITCALNYAALGLTAQDLADIQATAYTYEIRIIGTAGTNFLNYLDALLDRIEPARSTHFIYNNYPVT